MPSGWFHQQAVPLTSSIAFDVSYEFSAREDLMSLDHRYLWSTAFVRELLRTERLSEAAMFRYFLVIMAFDWLQFTLIATTPTPRISTSSNAGSWVTFAITVLGLLYLYRRNGGGMGKQFLRRYFPLSVTVGLKFVAAMLVVGWCTPVVLADQGKEIVGWGSALALAAINISMIWRIGFHLNLLSRETRD
ncbi:hypothetical protein IB243_04040 [Acidovorax sp. ACV01]|nr:hypothetical protein [Acidovorax sp. ACV01]